MTVLPEDIEQMARYLGRDEPAIQRLIRVCLRDPKMTETVRNLLRRRCLEAGFDPDDPPLFCPVRDLPSGFISIGHVLQGTKPGSTFALPRPLLCQHIGLFGHNGTGKSFLAMRLAVEAMRAGLRVWIFDIEDEYSRLIPLLSDGDLLALEPDQIRWNFFQPPAPAVSPASWLGEINLLLRGGTFLRDGSLNLFHTGMAKLLDRKGVTEGKMDFPSLLEVIQHFRGMGFGPKSRNVGFLESLLNRLQMLSEAFQQTANITNSDMLGRLARRSVIFRLHRMTGIPLQFFVGYLLLWLAKYREGTPDCTDHLVIIEEAHMLASEKARQDIGESVLCRMFRTARKRRIGLILCDQVPSELPPAILGNLGCRVVMRLINARCIWSVQCSMGLQREQAEAIAELQPRQAIVQYQLHPTPFMIEVPELNFPEKPDPSDLHRQAHAVLSQIQYSTSQDTVAGKPRSAETPGPAPDDLTGDALLVMVRICKHPAEPIEQRCQILRMDRAREFRARAELDNRGLIQQARQTVAGKVRFFQPTSKGIAWAKQHGIRVKKFKSGIIHEYLLSQIEKRIGRAGPRWRLQRNSTIARDQGLQPDLLVLAPDGQRIIVEVCCNNLSYDAQNILVEAAIPGIDKVIAVTPDKKILRQLKDSLQKHRASSSAGPPANIVLLDAGQCLRPEFDWPGVLLGQ